MKLPALASSLVVLSLFAGAALAGTGADPGAIVVAQADDTAESDQGGDRIEAVKKFLAVKRPSSKMKDDQLEKRLKRAQALLKTKDLPADLQGGLNAEIAEIQTETQKRQASGGATVQPEQKSTEATDDGGQDAMEQPAEKQTAETAAPASGDAAAILATQDELASLDNKALRAQMKKAADLMKASGTAKDDKKKLREFVKAARAELDKRKSSGTKASTESSGEQTAQKDSAAPAATGDAASVLNDTPPLASLNDKDLRERMRAAAKLMRDQNTSAADKKKAREIVRAARAETEKRKAGGKAPSDDANAEGASKPVDAPAGGDAEAKAKSFLNDGVDAGKLSNADLRKRLEDIRATLAGGTLSKETNAALRKQLAAEKAILRGRVDKAEGGDGSQSGDTTVTGDNNTTIINNVTINKYVNDRRPAKDLKDDELRIRIRVLLQAERDTKYSEAERRAWRDLVARDRQELNVRLLALRKKRHDELRIGVNTGKVKFNLGLNFQPDRRPPPYVFAAEADDEDIEEILSAPPRRKLERRYTVAEVENEPELRDAVARIEIDTVRFGFGESFLREEEIENLDRIAEVMEEILAVSPGERFMVEGHTDLVGSDAANLQLSRERAKAVKAALAEYYVIPPENLETMGFGEKYPKIPTEDAEPENRRVSVARITALVGALGQ